MTRLCVTCVLILSLSCASGQPHSNETIARFLATVEDPNDPRLTPVIDRVLRDIEQGTYIYDDEVRKYVFTAIGKLCAEDQSVRARVRLIANRPLPKEQSSHAPLEFVSVLGALSVLTSLNDKDAVSLNVAHLTDHFLAQTAVEDLRYLKAWNVTQDVERAFLILQRKRRHDPVVFASYILFLQESPHTSVHVCASVTRFVADVESCCARSHAAAIDLLERLRCPTRPE